MEKTAITNVTEGFDFLGFHVQYMTPSNSKPWLWVRPTEANIERFLEVLEEVVQTLRNMSPLYIKAMQEKAEGVALS